MRADNDEKEIAYYYPNSLWHDADWAKNLILFFDGIALLVPHYMKDKPALDDQALIAGLEEHGLIHILDPEKVIDATATQKLATALTDVIVSGALDNLSERNTAFHHLSMSRLGYAGDHDLADMIFKELRARGLARESEDGNSIPMHPLVRSLVLTLLSQILRSYGPQLGAELSPATDRVDLVESLSSILTQQIFPSTGSVISFDLATVGVDLGAIPINEILDFRAQNLEEHRRYCKSIKKFSQELSILSEADREIAFDLRQSELNDLSHDLARRARAAWKKPAAFGLSIAGAAVSLAAGHPLAAALSIGAASLNFSPTPKPKMGAYSYVFRASGRFPY